LRPDFAGIRRARLDDQLLRGFDEFRYGATDGWRCGGRNAAITFAGFAVMGAPFAKDRSQQFLLSLIHASPPRFGLDQINDLSKPLLAALIRSVVPEAARLERENAATGTCDV
jgi:hypothetical protein